MPGYAMSCHLLQNQRSKFISSKCSTMHYRKLVLHGEEHLEDMSLQGSVCGR